MKIQYVANDGAIFENEEVCVKYEKRFEERAKRRDQVEKAYEKYCELQKAYIKDYGAYHGHNDSLEYLRKVLNV